MHEIACPSADKYARIADVKAIVQRCKFLLVSLEHVMAYMQGDSIVNRAVVIDRPIVSAFPFKHFF
jgi:hypothetical protein